MNCTLVAVIFATVSSVVPPLLAQDVLHYRFEEGCGAEAVNHASGSTVGPATINTTLPGGVAAARVPGQFGTGLTGTIFPIGPGTTWLNTGWAPNNYSGSFTVAMWLRNRPGNPTAISFGYLFGATGGNFRLFTGSSGKLFLSGVPASVTSVANLTTQLNAGWVHAACVVDASANQATWYINGVADPAVTLSSAVNLAGTNFGVGARDSGGSSPSPLDTDEFLFTTQALSAAEIAALALAPRGGDGRFGTSCNGSVLSGNGQRPSLGNAGFGLTVTAPNQSLAWIVMGFSRCTMLVGTVALPTSLGLFTPDLAGCTGFVDNDFGVAGPILLSPSGTLAFPVPNQASLQGFTFWGQSVMLDLVTGQLRSSNAIGVSVGG